MFSRLAKRWFFAGQPWGISLPAEERITQAQATSFGTFWQIRVWHLTGLLPNNTLPEFVGVVKLVVKLEIDATA